MNIMQVACLLHDTHIHAVGSFEPGPVVCAVLNVSALNERLFGHSDVRPLLDVRNGRACLLFLYFVLDGLANAAFCKWMLDAGLVILSTDIEIQLCRDCFVRYCGLGHRSGISFTEPKGTRTQLPRTGN